MHVLFSLIDIFKKNFDPLVISFFLLLTSICLLSHASYADDYVFNEDSANIKTGRDTLGGRFLSLNIDLGLNNHKRIDITTNINRLNNNNTEYNTGLINIGYGSSSNDQTNWRVATSLWGKRKSVETKDILFDVIFYSDDLFLSIGLEFGELEMFVKPAVAQALMLSKTSANSERKGLRTSFGQITSDYILTFGYFIRSYERNLAGISQSTFIQTILQTEAIDQAYSLSSKEISFELGTFVDDFQLGVIFSEITTVVSDEKTTYTTLYGGVSIYPKYYVELGIDIPSDHSLISTDISLRFFW